MFRKDPVGFIVMFGAWASLNGITLLVTEPGFERSSIFHAMAQIGFPPEAWATVMLATGLALVSCPWFKSQILKSGLSAVAGAVWVVIGLLWLMGAASHGWLSAAGSFSIVCGLQSLLVATSQWVWVEKKDGSSGALDNPVRDSFRPRRFDRWGNEVRPIFHREGD